MKPVLYTLAGVAAAFAFLGLCVLAIWAANWLFGERGPMVVSFTMIALGGGGTGWLIYRIRNPKPKP
jgi:uncharacterized membrane protein YqjE